MTPRPSSLDRVAACRASYAESIGKPSLGSEDTANGNVLHEAVANWINVLEEPTRATVEALIAKHKATVDPDDVIEAATWAYQWLTKTYPGFLFSAEVDLGIGTSDVVGKLYGDDPLADPIEVVIVDWKSAAKEGERTDARLQLLDYASAAWAALKPNRVHCAVAYPNLKRADPIILDASQLEAIGSAIYELRREAVKQVDLPVDRRSYRAGVHCGYCPGKDTCPAFATMTKQVGAVLTNLHSPITLDAQDLPLAFAWKKKIEDALEDLKAVALRALQSTPGGAIKGDMGTLSLVSKRNPPRYTFNDAVTWMRENGLGDRVDEMERAIVKQEGPPSVFPQFRPKKSESKLIPACDSVTLSEGE